MVYLYAGLGIAILTGINTILQFSNNLIQNNGYMNFKQDEYTVMPDRIEAGTYLIAAAVTEGDLKICGIKPNIIKTEIDTLSENELIISVDLLDEFTQFVIFDGTGALVIKRLASIKNYPSIEDMKKMNQSSVEDEKQPKKINKKSNYHSLSKLDLKILLKEINESFTNESRVHP